MKKLKPLFNFILVISIGFGAFCFLYPVISNAINEQFNESKINEYNENTDTLTDAQIQSCFAEAQRYNRALAEDVSEKSDAGVLSQYDDILNINAGIMGYLEIPAIDVKLPVYHGDLQKAFFPLLKPPLQFLQQPVVAETDAFVRDLRGGAAGERRKPVVGELHALAEIVGDHGGGGIVLRQRHHDGGLPRAEKAADDCKFRHGVSSFFLIFFRCALRAGQ